MKNHAAELLKSMQFAARRAEERAAGRAPPPSGKRPAYWLCHACGNRLDKHDRCGTHRGLGPARSAARRHLAERKLCPCAFCERLVQLLGEGKSREVAEAQSVTDVLGAD